MDEYTNYLVHHGIKGMHWGVRRYQNADGSLTSAGRSKYGVGPKRSKKQIRADKKAAKKRAKAAVEKAKQLQKEKAARDRRMKTGPGAASEAVKMKEKDIKKLTEQYRNANAYMKERQQFDKYIDDYSPKEPTKLERWQNRFDKASKIATSVGTMYDTYNKVFGKTTMSEKEKVDLAQSKLNLQKTQIAVQKARHDFNKSLNDEIWQNRIHEAKRSTIFRTKSVMDEDLDKWTKRHKKENDFLDAVFYQYDKVKK